MANKYKYLGAIIKDVDENGTPFTVIDTGSIIYGTVEGSFLKYFKNGYAYYVSLDYVKKVKPTMFIVATSVTGFLLVLYIIFKIKNS